MVARISDYCVAARLRGDATVFVKVGGGPPAQEESFSALLSAEHALEWLAQYWIPELPSEPDRYPDTVSYLGLRAGERGPRWYATEGVILGFIPGSTYGFFRIPTDASINQATACQPNEPDSANIPQRIPRRRIIRSEAVLDGRWHIEGTRIPVAAIRADFAAGGIGAIEEIYLRAGLNREELFAALAFTFPEVQEPELQAHYAAVSVVCACGERAHGTLSGHESIAVICTCGRTWSCQLLLQPGEPDPDTPISSLMARLHPTLSDAQTSDITD